MRKTLLLVASAATLALAACNTEPETITVNQYDAQAKALENAAPVQLPPAITASRSYRCSDNSLVYVDFYNDNTAQLRTSQSGDPTTLTAAGGNPPYTADGYSVSANAENVRVTAPGKNNLSCHT
jgi:hypothetical protein